LFPASTALLTADLNHDIISFFLLIFEGKKKTRNASEEKTKEGLKSRLRG
jgi:hypothetical protein